MITELRITDPARTCVPWWLKAKVLEGRESIEFKPGLNILWGPNGSGKSSVVRAIARMLHCAQGGTQKVTDTSWRSVWDGGDYAMKLPSDNSKGLRDGAMPIHDGQPVMFFDATDRVGLIGGTFDYDFMEQGLMNATLGASHGQTTMARGGPAMMAAFKNGPVPAVEWKYMSKRPDPDAIHQDRRTGETMAPPTESRGAEILKRQVRWDTVKGVLDGTLDDTGIPTILLDEPDRSLDVPIQARFWFNLVLAAMERKRQIIAVSHSVFALGLPGVNYIEMKPGYLEASEQALRNVGLMEAKKAKEAKS